MVGYRINLISEFEKKFGTPRGTPRFSVGRYSGTPRGTPRFSVGRYSGTPRGTPRFSVGLFGIMCGF